MAKPNITRRTASKRPEVGRRAPTKPAIKREREFDEFHETLAAPAPTIISPIPNQTYREEIDLADEHATGAEQFTRIAATFLGTIVALRFMTNLFSSDQDHSIVRLFNAATQWFVGPFQLIFGTAPNNGSGYVDIAALAAIITIGLVAALIIRLLRPNV